MMAPIIELPDAEGPTFHINCSPGARKLTTPCVKRLQRAGSPVSCLSLRAYTMTQKGRTFCVSYPLGVYT
jgi:hypothetical protein